MIAETATLRMLPMVCRLPRRQPADVDDPAPALRLHVRRNGARAAQVAHHLDVDFALQLRGVDLGERGRRRVAARPGRGVDEDVDAAAERGSRLGDRALDLRVVAGVGDDGDDGRAGLVDDLGRAGGEPLRVAREDRDRRAFEREAARDRLADAAAAAGDESALALEFEVHWKCLPRT